MNQPPPCGSLALVLAADPETPLTKLLAPFDRYALEMDLADASTPAPWATVLAWETAAQVQDWATRPAARIPEPVLQPAGD